MLMIRAELVDTQSDGTVKLYEVVLLEVKPDAHFVKYFPEGARPPVSEGLELNGFSIQVGVGPMKSLSHHKDTQP